MKGIPELIEDLKRQIEAGREAERTLKTIEVFFASDDVAVDPPKGGAGQRAGAPSSAGPETKTERAKRIRQFAKENRALSPAGIKEALGLAISNEAVRLILVNKSAHDPEYDPGIWVHRRR